MPHRASLPIVLAVLAACQSTSPAPLPDEAEAWRAQIERTQSELRGEAEAVRSLLVARGMASDDSEALAAGLSALRDQLVQLDARLVASGSAQATNASYSVTDDRSSGDIESLKQALLVLEAEHGVHCENIAHAGVPAYKRRMLTTSTVSHENGGGQVPKVLGSRHQMQQGVLELTGNQLDFAIEGDGFFEVQRPDGSLFYKRDGVLRQEFNGRLVTPEGYLLTDHVAIPPDCAGISVSQDGQVFALEGTGAPVQIGTIRLSTFASNDGLIAVQGNGFAPTASSGQAMSRQPGVQGTGKIRQGYLERSNVHLTDELISLQLVERRAAAVRQALATLGVYVP